MPPIFYGAYLVGSTVLGTKSEAFHFEPTWDWVVNSLSTIGPSFLLGCGICSVVFGLTGYYTLNWLWRFSVRKAWQLRKEKRRQAQQNQQ